MTDDIPKDQTISGTGAGDDGHCHGRPSEDITGLKNLIIVGNPNVGKSMVFNKLTGSYVTVSNYPGTTVCIDKGKAKIGGMDYGIIDSPGMYSLNPITEEERISKLLLIEGSPDIVLNVVDAKNLVRMLPLTLQLVEAGLPVILVLNMMDEAVKQNLMIDIPGLSDIIGIPVVGVTAISGEGIDDLRTEIINFRASEVRGVGAQEAESLKIGYDAVVEKAVEQISHLISGDHSFSKRSIALALLQDDEDMAKLVSEKEGEDIGIQISRIVKDTADKLKFPLKYIIKKEGQHTAMSMIDRTVSKKDAVAGRIELREKLSLLMIRPMTGIPILLIILYLAFYKIVGEFGAGYLVDLIEVSVFNEGLNPAITEFVNSSTSNQALRDLFIGEYGLVTLGLTYAIAIILPIVGAFFLVFSIIEDSGYLPRLALLVDRSFKRIGLTGRAIIPMVLGLGCDTMATMVTRTQETNRERVISTLLLAMAIPCSAQLGVIFAIMSDSPKALILWILIMTGVLVMVGWLASKLLPGNTPSFYMELPPLRMPSLVNVLTKTYTRMVWYFKEILPIFLLVSVIIWALDLAGLFTILISGMEPLVNGLGLPDNTAQVFLFGFFRRDYGAAGLYDIQASLTGVQILVAAVTLTLFVPCVAQFLIMIKERGIKTAVLIFIFILFFAFGFGFLLNQVLTGLGVSL